MKTILILFAHPAFQKSRINSRIVESLPNMNGVTVHDLYEAYPEFDVDVAYEQRLLAQHDIIVFHHPLFWYSTPAILKEWQDLVLEHGWAYGSRGNALRGKLFFNVITAGGAADAYTPEGYNGYTLRQLLVPIEQTVNLCKMIFLPPFVVHGTHSIKMTRVEDHRQSLHHLLEALNQDGVDVDKARRLPYLNDYLPYLEKTPTT